MTRPERNESPSEYLVAVRNGVLLGLLVLAVLVPTLHWLRDPAEPIARSSASADRQVAAANASRRAAPPRPRYASFGDEHLSADARHVAHWAVHSGDHKNMSFVIIDKKDAKVYVFNPRGELVSSTPALLGAAHGDHSVPGIGEKPLSQVLPDEKTTPAGRFVAEPGTNLKGEDIIWVDYDAAVSMHRVRPLVAAERRLERLSSPTPDDNRISFGCINLPVPFYETVLSPTVKATGAIVYVLPEVRTPQEVFGSYDVSPPWQWAGVK
jgi:hypothetical protein